MTDHVTTACATCGAENLGTRFCESCGARAEPADAPAPEPSPTPTPPPSEFAAASPVAPADPGHVFRALALTAFILGIFITTCLGIASSGGALIPDSAYVGVPVVTGLAVGLFMLISALIGTASPPGKAFGALFALAYALTVVVQTTVPYQGYDAITPYLLPLLGPVFLFLSWGAGRPFRGPGYAAVIAVGLLAFASQFVSPVVGSTYAGYAILLGAVLLTDVVIIVTTAKALDGSLSNGRRVEPLTRASLALVLTTFALNGIAGSVPGAALAWYVVIILLLVTGIIVGHAGFVRAGRRGEKGRGIAATALVVGYIVLIANLAVIIWLATVLASLSSLSGLS